MQANKSQFSSWKFLSDTFYLGFLFAFFWQQFVVTLAIGVLTQQDNYPSQKKSKNKQNEISNLYLLVSNLC